MNINSYYTPQDLADIELQKEKLSMCLETMSETCGLSLEQGKEIVNICELLPMHQSRALIEALDGVRTTIFKLNQELIGFRAAEEIRNDGSDRT